MTKSVILGGIDNIENNLNILRSYFSFKKIFVASNNFNRSLSASSKCPKIMNSAFCPKLGKFAK